MCINLPRERAVAQKAPVKIAAALQLPSTHVHEYERQ